MTRDNLSYIFFGTGHIARYVLDELEHAGLLPALVVSAPDAKRGRGMELSPSLVGAWALERSIETLKPENIGPSAIEDIRTRAKELGADVFVVVDYGYILPPELLAIPSRGILNMHPSLLPRLRGPSPIRSAILQDEREVGVSIIRIDEKMDHGPIVAQKKVAVPEWPASTPNRGEPPRADALEELLAREGGRLLAQMLPLWLSGQIEEREQNHDVATYCTKFTKEDGMLDLSADPYQNLLKIRAFEGWPGTFAFFERGGKRIRVQILDARLEGEDLVIESVKPEGKARMPYADFLRSGAKPVVLQ